MPAFASREDEGRAFLRLGGESGGEHIRLDLPALAVEPLQHLRDAARLLRIAGGEQPGPEPRFPDAPARIDPGAQHETQMVGARPPFDTGGGKQGRDAGVAPPRQHFEAARHERPVEAGELHHVRDRAERHEVEPFAQVRFRAEAVAAAPAERAVGGHDQEEDDPDRRESAERTGLLHAVGVHHGQRFREAGLRQVVVEDDAFEAEARGMGERCEGRGAAIDQQHQPVSRFREPVEGRFVRAVALGDAVRHMDARLAARCLEEPSEQRGRGRAVHVVVGEYGDGFAGFGRIGKPLGRHVHVLEARRVRQRSPELRLEEGRRGLRRHAPVGQYARCDVREPLPLGNRRRRPRVSRPLAPGPPPERARDTEERLSLHVPDETWS